MIDRYLIKIARFTTGITGNSFKGNSLCDNDLFDCCLTKRESRTALTAKTIFNYNDISIYCLFDLI